MRIVSCIIILQLLAVACQSPSQKDRAVDHSADNMSVDSAIPIIDYQLMPSPSLYSKDVIMGKLIESRDSNFVLIKSPYSSRDGMYLRREALESFMSMADAAKKDGVSLVIISAMRNYDRQRAIWEAKWNGVRLVSGRRLPESHPDHVQRALKILEYSSMPGSSRHHWGTDIDINALENSYFAQGRGAQEYAWLIEHAASYGWCQPYSSKADSDRSGYEEEKWHWSYLPIARELTDLAERELRNDDFDGFDGSETAGEIDIIGAYILGVDGSCR